MGSHSGILFLNFPLIFVSIFCFHRRNLVRNTRQNQLKSVDNSSNEQVFLGKQGKDFEFSHLSQTIEVAECSSKDNDIDSIYRWLKNLK